MTQVCSADEILSKLSIHSVHSPLTLDASGKYPMLSGSVSKGEEAHLQYHVQKCQVYGHAQQHCMDTEIKVKQQQNQAVPVN